MWRDKIFEPILKPDGEYYVCHPSCFLYHHTIRKSDKFSTSVSHFVGLTNLASMLEKV